MLDSSSYRLGAALGIKHSVLITERPADVRGAFLYLFPVRYNPGKNLQTPYNHTQGYKHEYVMNYYWRAFIGQCIIVVCRRKQQQMTNMITCPVV